MSALPTLSTRMLCKTRSSISQVSIVCRVYTELFGTMLCVAVTSLATAPLESWQPPLKEKVVVSLEVQVDDSILPKYGDGDVLPWPQQV